MAATSKAHGRDVVFRDGRWRYTDTGALVSEQSFCGHCGRSPLPVWVRVPADLSSTGRTKWKTCLIDACVAKLVGLLQDAGVDMRGSCCGHGRYPGSVDLQDGRSLIVLDPEAAAAFLKGSRPDERGAGLRAAARVFEGREP